MPASYLVPALEQESPTIQHYNTGPCNWQNQCLQCFKHKPQRAACHKYQQSAEAGLQGSTFNSSVGSANVAVFHILPQQNQHQPPFTAAKPVRSRLASSCKLEHQAKHRRSHSANLIMTTFEPPPPPPPPPPHTHIHTHLIALADAVDAGKRRGGPGAKLGQGLVIADQVVMRDSHEPPLGLTGRGGMGAGADGRG